MKYTLLATALLSLSTQAVEILPSEISAPSLAEIKNLKTLVLPMTQKNLISVNGKTFMKKTLNKAAKADLSSVNSTQGPDISVITGDVVFSEDGFNTYQVTGEILVKLDSDYDFTSFNAKHELSIKQAYNNFYILKSNDNSDLLPIVEELAQTTGIASVTLDLLNLSINTH